MQRDLSIGGTRPSHRVIVDFVLTKLRKFTEEHFDKFMGLAMPQRVAQKCPDLCSRLWTELDVIPLVLPEEQQQKHQLSKRDLPMEVNWELRETGEQAESMSRKCVRLVLDMFLLAIADFEDCSVRITFHYCKLVSRVWWKLIPHLRYV